MAVLITGGTGFIGLNLAEHLLGQGADVVLHGLRAPTPKTISFLSRLGGALSVVEGDVRDATMVGRIVAKHAIDRVIHAAAVTAGPERERADFADVVDVNVTGTVRLLEAARRAKIRRVLVLSSVAVYGPGTGTEREFVEDRTPPCPMTLYAVTKCAAERLALRYAETLGLDVMAARVGAVFGRWEHTTGLRDTMSVPFQLVVKALRGEEAVLPPAKPKDWIYAPDLARALCGLLVCRAPTHRLYNAGSGQVWPVEACAEALRRHFPKFGYRIVGAASVANITYHGNPARPPMSIERLRQETGFAPRFDVDAAFTDYATWIKEFPSLIVSA